jgi:phosphoribosylformylglycinamidine synthase
MLGIVDDVRASVTAALQNEGDVLFLLTPSAWMHRSEIDGTEYLASVHNRTTGDAPHLDLDEEVAVQNAARALIGDGLVQHAHDVSDGGLAITLAESVIHADGLGAEVDLPDAHGHRLDGVLFGEAQSRILVSVRPDDADRVDGAIEKHDATAHRIGTVTTDGLQIQVNGERVIDVGHDALETPYRNAIPDAMQGGEAVDGPTG